MIQAGQSALALIPLEDLYVTANFKETQLRHMRAGQKVTLKVDALGGREYRAHIDTIAPATGARFSLLPPENATGNYVKVVQRVPVKIALEPGKIERAPAARGNVGRAEGECKVTPKLQPECKVTPKLQPECKVTPKLNPECKVTSKLQPVEPWWHRLQPVNKPPEAG